MRAGRWGRGEGRGRAEGGGGGGAKFDRRRSMERITIRRTIVTILWKTNLLLLSSGSGNSFLHVPAVSTSPAPWLFLSKRDRHDSDFLPQPMVAHHVIAWSILDCALCMVFYSTQIKQQEFDRSCRERERAGKKGT